jgi:DNA replication protein DnaC
MKIFVGQDTITRARDNMQTENLLEKMTSLKLVGMADALREQTENANIGQLSFEERLSIILERETLHREDKRLSNLLRQAKLREKASFEDIVYEASRKLNRSNILSLANCGFINNHHNIAITGASGCGKTFMACAIGHKACRLGYKVRYIHLPRFIEDISISHADGSYTKIMTQLNKVDLLILDDFGLTPITSKQCHDLFNIIEERHQLKSTIITSQLPIDKWHQYLGEPTLADAILDRILQNINRIEMGGESMRKRKNIDAS